MDLKLDGKRALICGGSSGLGRAVATALVAEGAHVALLSRDEGKLQAVADALNASGPGKAVVVTADRVLPAMRAAGWGRILNVASITVVEPSAALGVSNTLRASVAAWAKTLANEVGPDGVTVNTLLPGRIDTPRIERLDQATAERTGTTPQEARAESVKSIPVSRIGTTEEFGATAAFLASPLAAYVTGSLIRLDGGAIKAI